MSFASATEMPLPAAPASTFSANQSPATDLQTVWLYNPAGIRGDGISVDTQLKAVMQNAGIKKPPLAGQSNMRIEMILTDDPYPAANKLFYQRGWTDGLPIIPPTGDQQSEPSRNHDRHSWSRRTRGCQDSYL
jgi:hypothetical protein